MNQQSRQALHNFKIAFAEWQEELAEKYAPKEGESIHQITSERFYQQARNYIIKQQEGA